MIFPASLLSSPHVNRIRCDSRIQFTKLRSAKRGVENALIPYKGKHTICSVSTSLQQSFINTISLSDLANAIAEHKVRCRMSLYTGQRSFSPQVRNSTGYCGCFMCNLYQEHKDETATEQITQKSHKVHISGSNDAITMGLDLARQNIQLRIKSAYSFRSK
jgi:hypothetical protein